MTNKLFSVLTSTGEQKSFRGRQQQLPERQSISPKNCTVLSWTATFNNWKR